MHARQPITSVLSIGKDPVLLNSRNAVLLRAGYSVVSAMLPDEIVERFFGGDFDVVVLCHSVPREERERITRLVKQHSPSVAVVVVTNVDSMPIPKGAIGLTSQPEVLVTGLEAVSARPPIAD